ncbi:MAG: hypothetical protein R6W90_01210 [Ignavibacteriaceae bacterium]
MRISILFFFMILSIGLISCSDSDSTSPEDKTYDVEYRVTGSANVSEIRYLTHTGDTLTALNINSGWSYKWANKGKSGDQTYLRVLLVNTSGMAHLQILANNSVLLADSIEGYANAVVSLGRGTTLPY